MTRTSMQQVYLIPEAFLSGSKQVRTPADAVSICCICLSPIDLATAKPLSHETASSAHNLCQLMWQSPSLPGLGPRHVTRIPSGWTVEGLGGSTERRPGESSWEAGRRCAGAVGGKLVKVAKP